MRTLVGALFMVGLSTGLLGLGLAVARAGNSTENRTTNQISCQCDPTNVVDVGGIHCPQVVVNVAPTNVTLDCPPFEPKIVVPVDAKCATCKTDTLTGITTCHRCAVIATPAP